MADIKKTDIETSNLNAELKTLSNRSYLVLSLCLFVGTVVLAIWGIVPKFNSLTTQHAQIQNDKQALVNLEEKITQIQTIANDQTYKKQTELVNKVLSENNPFLEVLYALTQAGEKNSLKFSRFEYSPGLIATASAQYLRGNSKTTAARSLNAQQNQGFTIYVETNGSYIDIVNFLDQLENTAPLASVSFTEINNSLLGYASAKIEILAHYYKPNVVAQLSDSLPIISSKQKEILEKIGQFNLPQLDNLTQADLVGGKNDIFSQVVLEQQLEEETETKTEN